MLVKKAIYPGSFDPLTLGHLDIIQRASSLVDHLVVAVMHNPEKSGFLPPATRAALILESCQDLGITNLSVLVDSGLLVDLAKNNDTSLIIKGLRNASDLEMETAMAQANSALLPGLETLFLTASGQAHGISSSLVRQIYAFAGNIKPFVPPRVAAYLHTLQIQTQPKT